MAAAVTQFSHADIDPGSIKVASFGHDDVDPSSISVPSETQANGFASIFNRAAHGALQAAGGDVTPTELRDKTQRVARSTINTVVPVVSAVGAGALAGPESGLAASVPAGAAGWAAGKQLARLLNHYVLGDPLEANGIGGAALQTANDLGEGAAYEIGGKAIAAVPGVIKSVAEGAQNTVRSAIGKGVEFTPSASAPVVSKAAGELGINVPQAVLTDNPTFQKLESGLSQSGSFPARATRNQYNDFFKAIEKASSKIEDLKSTQSDFSLGSAIKSDLAKQVSAKTTPVSELYQDVVPELQRIPVDQPTVNRVFGSLKSNPLFKTQDGINFLNEHRDIVSSLPELNSLKEFRSSLYDSLGKDAAPADAKRVDALVDAMTSVRDKSINAMKSQLPPELHPEVDNLIDRVSLADSAHHSNLQDLNSIKSLVGNGNIKSPVSFLRQVGTAKEAGLAERAANLDVASMQNLKDKFPSVFDKAQAAKINDMVQRSTNPVSGFNVNSFMKQYSGLDQEAKDLIFSKDIQSHIENLKTVKQAIPPKLGPSGTPEGQMMMDMFNPKRNALDLGVKSALNKSVEKAAAAPAIENPASSANVPARVLQMFQPASQAPASATIPAAAQNQPTKGPDKWATDGIQKLIDHTGDQKTKVELQNQKGAMLQDPAVKNLLIQASDLKPGTKAMDAVMTKLKAKLAQGDDQ